MHAAVPALVSGAAAMTDTPTTGCCPSCGTPTQTFAIRRGNGASMETSWGDEHCDSCIRARVRATRAARECHCSQIEQRPHVHDYDEATT